VPASEAPSTAGAILAARRQHLLRAGASAVFCAFAVFTSLTVCYHSWIRPLRGALAFSLVQTAFQPLPAAASIVFCLWLYYRFSTPVGPAPLILWLRKFHLLAEGPAPFHRVLGVASTSLGIPITIRDTRLSTNLVRGGLSMVVAMPFVMVGLQLVFAFLLLLGSFPARRVSGGLAVGLVIAVLGTSLVAWPIYGLVRRRGVVHLPGPTSPQAVSAWLDALRRRPNAHPGGVLVMAVDEDDWQAVVREAIRSASVVIVDVSEVSKNVLWEIETVLEERAADVLILAREHDTPARGNQLAKLGPIAKSLAGVPTFWYSVAEARWRHRWMAKQLGIQLAQRLASAPIGSPGRALRYPTSSLRAPIAACAVLLLASAFVGWTVPRRLSDQELRRLTLTAIGAPYAFGEEPAQPLIWPPNENLIATLRYTVQWEQQGRHPDVVIELMSTHGDPANPWLLLARGRAFLLNDECDCRTPLIVSISTAEAVAINTDPVSERYLEEALLDRFRKAADSSHPKRRRRIVLFQVRPETPLDATARIVRAVANVDFVMAVAPDPLTELHRLCGAEVLPGLHPDVSRSPRSPSR
jgi:hypothetical protein